MKLCIRIMVRCLSVVLAVLLSGCMVMEKTPPPNADMAVSRRIAAGFEYLQMGQPSEARRHISRALEHEPRSSEAHNAMALLYNYEGDQKRAEEHYQRAIRYNKSYSVARNNYGAMLMTQRRYKEALGQFSLAADDPSYDNRAIAFENKGRALMALERHNVFFQPDYASEFTDIFQRQRLPQQPTVYVCAQDRGGPSVPAGAERLLCLVNAPAAGDQNGNGGHITPEAIEQCETNTWALLRSCGLNLQPTSQQIVRTTPADFHHLFPATGGALYGQASHGWTSAFARSGANTPVPGLFLAGGSVHPGPGVPMAALSGLRAAEAVMANPALTRWCPPVATSGGTSTP